MEYCFARSYNRLAAADFDPSYKNSSHKGVRLAQIAKHVRFLGLIAKGMLALPESILTRCGSTFDMFLTERKVRRRVVASLTSDSNHSTIEAIPSN